MNQRAGLLEQDLVENEDIINSDYISNPLYDVKTETGNYIGIKILLEYFGNLWQIALDRIDHKIDGHLMTIHFHGQKYYVYRLLDQHIQKPMLHLV